MHRLLALPLLLASSLFATAQTDSPNELSRMAGCTLQGRTYTCSRADLKRALSLSKSITAISRPANHASDSALAALIRDLGKTAATADSPSDLTFLLEPLQDSGVAIGPGTADLARLRVLITAPDAQEGKLLWVETYRGDPSMVWPAIARATTAALRDGLRSR